MKWMTFWIQGLIIVKSNILSNTMKKVYEFHQQYPNKPKFVPSKTCH
jgi:hypothetical protein